MADLFDALVARALGVGPALTPVLPARFADRADPAEPGLEFGEPIARDDYQPAALPSASDRSQLTLGALAPDGSQPPTAPVFQPVPMVAPVPRAQPAIQPDPPLVARPLGQPRIDASDRPIQEAEPDRRESVTTRAPGVAVDPGSVTSPIERPSFPTIDRIPDPTLAPIPRTAEEPITAPITPRIEPIRAARVTAPGPTAAPAPDFSSEQAARAQVTISIGRVELRAPTPREQARPARTEPTRWPQPRISLDDYLRRGPRR